MAFLNSKMILTQLLLVSLLAAATNPFPLPQALPKCRERCGEITVSYPFGIGDGCYLSLMGLETAFSLVCDDFQNPPSLNWTKSYLTLGGFNVSEGEAIVTNDLSWDCYNKYGPSDTSRPWLYFNYPFSISGPKNRFVAVGCDTYAVFKGFRGEEEVMTGCMSVCLKSTTVQPNTCSGAGCCTTEIPDGLTNRTLTLGSYYNHTTILDFNPCSYSFLVQNDYFKFKGISSFEELQKLKIKKMPMVVNWQIGRNTCEVAKKGQDYVCKGNTTCVTQSKGLYQNGGYYCQCLPGYEGNPYIGCQDIDECLNGTNLCKNGTCENSRGNYSCKCYEGFKNEDKWKCVALPANNTLIISSKENSTPLKISLGVCLGFFVLLVIFFALYREYKRRQFNKMRKKYFDANGGPILDAKLQQLANQNESSLALQKFSAEDLEKATKNYNENEKIGEGGYGVVYKGVIANNKVVAVKASKMSVQKKDQFVTEIIILSQTMHKNVVKLIGYCLETEKPIMVYEYVPNGTLYDHIHKKKGDKGVLSLGRRLKIALETAQALSYLHHSTTMPIIHRDIKATNILLDKDFTAKVSDFGASKLVSDDDKTQLQTLVQGTLGYLDPEYLRSNVLTEKSDVYSFGVVLVELLTGENAVREDKPEAERNLANMFVSKMESDAPLDLLFDGEIAKEGNSEIVIRVAKLAEKCLSVKGNERPDMKEVENELADIVKALGKEQPRDNKVDATSNEEKDESRVEVSDVEYDASMQNQAQKPSSDYVR